jgi:hypothetical protein
MDEKGQVWEYDFNRWSLDDIIAFEAAGSLRDRLPLMQKALLKNPYNVDLSKPDQWKSITAYQWADIQRQFTAKVTEIFR